MPIDNGVLDEASNGPGVGKRSKIVGDVPVGYVYGAGGVLAVTDAGGPAVFASGSSAIPLVRWRR